MKDGEKELELFIFDRVTAASDSEYRPFPFGFESDIRNREI